MKRNEGKRKETNFFFYLRKRHTNGFSLLYLSVFLDGLLDRFSIFLRRRPFRMISYGWYDSILILKSILIDFFIL